MSNKVFEFKFEHEGKVLTHQYHIYCPGCKTVHAMGVGIHSFDGNFEQPTFSPSLLTYGRKWKEKKEDGIEEFRCHSFIVKGKIQFLPDCTHELKNQTVELPVFTEEMKRK